MAASDFQLRLQFMRTSRCDVFMSPMHHKQNFGQFYLIAAKILMKNTQNLWGTASKERSVRIVLEHTLESYSPQLRATF